MAAPEEFAAWAVAVEEKLQGLADDLDDEWQGDVLAPWAFLDALPDEQVRRLWPRLWQSRLGGLPTLQRLTDPLARLCLLSRGEVLNRLCALALARRPGVLRCCIDRSVRAPLQRALGDTFEPLLAMSRRGRPVDATTASWSPVIWACVGFIDWSAHLSARDGVVRQMVRLSLPRSLLDGLAGQMGVPAERDVPEALGALAGAGVAWPC